MKNLLKYKPFINENKAWFRNPTDEEIEAFDGNLIDIDNKDLSPDGIIEKLYQWQAKEGSIPNWLYQMSKNELDIYGYKIPKDIKVVDSTLE